MEEKEARFIPAGKGTSEIVIKRSRFIGELAGISSREEAREKIDRKRDEYRDSSHVVYAFILGDGNSETLGMSDDGEPKGTAGKPVLSVLRGSGFTNALLTVVRYFGGTKLGTGGLVKAYGDCARAALEETPRRRLRKEKGFLLTLPYELYEPAKRVILEREGRIGAENFAVKVELQGVIPAAFWDECLEEIRNLSGGICLLEERS